LRHHALIGSDDEQNHVNFGSASQHVVDEAFVTRDINDASDDPAGQSQVSKAEVNGHAPLPLFRVSVGLNPCQSPNECCLAVINMTCRPDNDVLGSHLSTPQRKF
jgi:hypothetical protein